MEKTFKFGQLLEKDDICDREVEIRLLEKICAAKGRAVVYGPRRFGKTSVVKNVTLKGFLAKNRKAIALYADFFQIGSIEDCTQRLRLALETSLSERAKIKTFIREIGRYLKHFRLEITLDPMTGAPQVALMGEHKKGEETLTEIFETLRGLSKDLKTLLVLDEFQDVTKIPALEGVLRSDIQDLPNTAVILMGSKRHILSEMFHNTSKPFYAFGVDVEFKKIHREKWLPYIRERLTPLGKKIDREGVDAICDLMRDVPNSVQELCHWVSLSEGREILTPPVIKQYLMTLIDNKSSRFREMLAPLSTKEKRVLRALANKQPVSSVGSLDFLKEAGVSATATRTILLRFVDQGMTDYSSEEGYSLVDPLLGVFLLKTTGDL